MPVTGATTRNDYVATNGQTVFTYTFQVLLSSDIEVIKNGVTLTLNSDYTVAVVGQSGGSVTLSTPAEAGDKVSVFLAMPIDRTTQYQNAGDFLASDVNGDFDKAYVAMNQLQTDIGRSLTLQDEDPTVNTGLPLKAARANKYLYFDVNGEPSVSAGTDGISPVVHSLVIETALDIGSNEELEIYRDNPNSFIKNNSGVLKILSDSLFIKNNSDDEFILKGTANAGVELFHNDVKRFETITNGSKTIGNHIVSTNLGVNIDAPLKPLHVYHPTTDLVCRFESGDSGAGLELKDLTTTALMNVVDGVMRISADNSNEADDSAILFKVDNVEEVSITSEGIFNGQCGWYCGAGSPEGVVTAAVGSIYTNRVQAGAGTTFWVKESGTGNTGWVAK